MHASGCAAFDYDFRRLVSLVEREPRTPDELVRLLDAIYEMAKRKRQANAKRAEGEKHAELLRVRLGSRLPVYLPQRITPELVNMLRKYHPLYINTHFNHPEEITEQAEHACTLLADAGIPLGCQTVLLKGVNDSLPVMRELLYRLLDIRVRPYYLMQADLTEGTAHFRTDIQTGLDIMRGLIGTVSGMAVPTYILDAPEGKGKIPLTPDYILSHRKDTLEFSNYQGIPCSYPFSCS